MRKKFIAIFLFASITLSAQWSQVNTGLTNLTSGAKLLGHSDSYLFAGTLGGAKMYRSNTYGNSWTEINTPVIGVVPECGYAFGGKYFSGLNSAQNCIFYSNDNGSTWNTTTGGPQATWVRGFLGIASGKLFAYTSTQGIFKSIDAGSTWDTANVGLTNLNVIAIEKINSKFIAATIGGGVFVSSNEGDTWMQSNSGISAGDLNASALWQMGGKLYYIDQAGSAYSSSNDGASWTAWTKPSLLGLGLNEVYRSGNNLYIESRFFSGGLRDSIFISKDEGLTWTNITENLSATDLNASGITAFGGFEFVAYNMMSAGQGIYRRGIGTRTFDETPQTQLQIYPNPSKGTFSIAPTENDEEIVIVNSLGQEVMRSKTHEKEFIISLHESGIYFMCITTNQGTTVKKLMVRQ